MQTAMWGKLKFCITVLLFFGLASLLEAANTDSLKVLLQKSKEDTSKVRLLIDIGLSYLQTNNDSSIRYGKKALEISEKKDYEYGLIASNRLLGRAYSISQLTQNSIKHYFDALQVSDDDHKFKRLRASIHNSLGLSLVSMKRITEARRHYRQGLVLAKSMRFLTGTFVLLENLGSSFDFTKEKDSAYYYLNESLKLSKEIPDSAGMSRTLYNIGLLHKKNKEYEEAIFDFHQSLRISEKIGYEDNISYCYVTIAGTYFKLGNYNLSTQYFKQALEMAKKTNNTVNVVSAHHGLASSYKMSGDYKLALEHWILGSEIKDSISEMQNMEMINELATKYETEKKELQIEELENEKKIQDAEIAAKEEQAKRQKMQTMAFAGGFALMLVLAFVVYRNYRRKQKDNQIIAAQKQQVEKQKELVEVKNKEITDSITYAKRIQEAILPPHSLVKEHLPDSFIFYQPKDIVAGDFYWMQTIGHQVIFAAADCTGHGVPGAMVSVVCHNALNRSVLEFGLYTPAKILDKTRELVLETFQAYRHTENSESNVNDGMDIALFSLNTKTRELQFAGANNPLWLYRKGVGKVEDVEEIKADKQPIGEYAKPKPFSNHTLQLEKGDMFYVFSDGFADQFGGSKGKKFKYKPFKELLFSLQNEPAEIQRQKLGKAFEGWRGKLEQVDDVCIIGIKV